jgi:hypothetical protein
MLGPLYSLLAPFRQVLLEDRRLGVSAARCWECAAQTSIDYFFGPSQDQHM